MEICNGGILTALYDASSWRNPSRPIDQSKDQRETNQKGSIKAEKSTIRKGENRGFDEEGKTIVVEIEEHKIRTFHKYDDLGDI